MLPGVFEQQSRDVPQSPGGPGLGVLEADGTTRNDGSVDVEVVDEKAVAGQRVFEVPSTTWPTWIVTPTRASELAAMMRFARL